MVSGNRYVKDAASAQKAVAALAQHYGFMKQAGGAAEAIRANVMQHYKAGSSDAFVAKFTEWQDGYTKAMQAVDDIYEKLQSQQKWLDQTEETALQGAKQSFNDSSIASGIESMLNGGSGPTVAGSSGGANVPM